MKTPLRHSFSARLSFFILFFAAAIFVAAFAVFYGFYARAIEQEAQADSKNKLRTLSLEIEKVLRRVEAVPDNLKWIIANEQFAPDSMYGITQNVVRNNPDIYGCAIAFEPYYFKEKGYYFSPYSYRNGDTVRSLQLGNDNYDYFNWEWYNEPKRLGRSCWSEPYFDEGGGQMVMCTYSAPIYNNGGTMIGVFTSDISLEWLNDIVNSMKHSDRSYTFILGKDGAYIVHYMRERILNQTIFNVSEEMNNPTVKLIGEEMIAGKEGMQMFDNDGVKSFVFYAPVPHTQWSMGIVLPKSEVFSDLNRINLLLLLIVALGLIALFFICSRIITNLTKPLKRFAASAREIAHGKFDVRLPEIRSKDEMKELYHSFTYLQTELTNYIDNLKRTTSIKEKIESELRIARNIQMGMIPKSFSPTPPRKEIELHAVLHPAKEVGGDLYDFFLKGDNFYFAIGDVSGKGVPASLMMAVTLTLLRSFGARGDTPAQGMNALNAALSEHNDSNMFVTLLIGVLNLSTGVLKYCNAGHNPPLLQGKSIELIPNIPLGVIKDFTYREQSVVLSVSSVLTLYTDGVTEAENANNELYGTERLKAMVTRNANASPQAIAEAILTDIKQHVQENEPSDDIAMMVIKYRGTTCDVRCATRDSSVATLLRNDRCVGSNKGGSNGGGGMEPPLLTPSLSTVIAGHSDRREETFATNLKCTIQNRIEELHKVSHFIEQIGAQANLSSNLIMKLNLALEEAVSNIIFYAYREKRQKAEIEISASQSNDNLIFILSDNGAPFDPTLQDAPNIHLSVNERPTGGLGIFLIRQIMDKVEYQRIDEKNVLTLTINIKKI